MAGVIAEVSLNIVATLIGAGDLGNPKQKVTVEELLQFTEGTASTGQSNILFQDTRTLTASANEDLDLAGVLTDAFGATVTAAEIVLIYVKAKSTNTNSVVIGAATAPFAGPLGATGTYTLKPGEWVVMNSQTGWAVGAGSTDDLKIANSAGGTSVDYDILILGRTVTA